MTEWQENDEDDTEASDSDPPAQGGDGFATHGESDDGSDGDHGDGFEGSGGDHGDGFEASGGDHGDGFAPPANGDETALEAPPSDGFDADGSGAEEPAQQDVPAHNGAQQAPATIDAPASEEPEDLERGAAPEIAAPEAPAEAQRPETAERPPDDEPSPPAETQEPTEAPEPSAGDETPGPPDEPSPDDQRPELPDESSPNEEHPDERATEEESLEATGATAAGEAPEPADDPLADHTAPPTDDPTPDDPTHDSAGEPEAGDLPPRTLPPNAEVWEQHPGEFVPPTAEDLAAMPADLPPHTSPETFAPFVNDGGPEHAGRDVNCVDCARATERSWEGQPEVSGARAAGTGEEYMGRLTDWTGVQARRQSFDDVGKELEQRGPGSSAVLVSEWKGGGAHAYNAVNDAGTVKFVDSQPAGGAVGTWPSTRDSPGYGIDERDIDETWAWYLP